MTVTGTSGSHDLMSSLRGEEGGEGEREGREGGRDDDVIKHKIKF